MLALAFAGNATAGAILDRAAHGAAEQPGLRRPGCREVDHSPRRPSSSRTEIETKGHGPIYIAVLPNAALDEAGGDAVGIAVELHRQLGKPGVYAVVAGGHFRALVERPRRRQGGQARDAGVQRASQRRDRARR